MKKFNNKAFDIEMTTMRELNPDEIDQVGGGWITVPILISMALSCFGPSLCPEEEIAQK